MNVVDYLQHREHGISRKMVAKGGNKTLLALVEDQTATVIKNQACELSGLPRATFLMDFSPDGTKVASTHGDHTVRVTDVSSGKCTHVLTGHPRTPWCVAFHPSSNEILASGCLGGEVRIWDLLGGGSEVWHSPTNGVIASLSFHPMDHVLVFATGNTIYFWDWSQPEPFARSRTSYEFERIRWLRFDPLGHYLYTGIANNTTVHREEPSNVVHINETGGQHTNRQQQFVNRRRYQQVLQRFNDYQQERWRGGASGGVDGSGLDTEPHHDISTAPTPTSPDQEEGGTLNFGPHYVSRVQQRLRRAEETTRRAREIVSSISGRRRTNPYQRTDPRRISVLQSLQPGTWSPPPRVGPPGDDEIMDQEDAASGVTTPPQLSESAEMGAQRPLLVRPTSSSTLCPPLYPSLYPRSRSSIFPSGVPGRNSTGINWVDGRRNDEPVTPTSGPGPQSLNYGVNLRSGLRFDHLSSSSLRPVSGPNSVLSSSHVSSLNRLRSRPLGSAFREVSRRLRRHNPSTSNSSSASSSSSSSSSSTTTNTPTHTPCAICRTFNPSHNSHSVSTTATSNSGHLTSWSSSVPTSSGLFIPRSRPGVMSSNNRLLNMMIFQRSQSTPQSRNTTSHNSRNQDQTPKTDGTSQTSGAMELPESSDQGTDVVGLSEGATVDCPDEPESETLESEGADIPLPVPPIVNPLDLEVAMEVVAADQNNNPSDDSESILPSDPLPSGEGSRREDLTSLTMRLERQVSELDRRITALRERFTERLRALHQDRERILNLRGRISNQSSPESGEPVAAVTSGQPSQHVPLITITRPRDQGDFSHTPASAFSNTSSGSGSQNTHLLEMFLRGDGQQSTATQIPLPPVPSVSSVRVTPSREEDVYHEERSWHALQQRHLHPHYSVSILDDTINRPNDALHAAINRAIAGAFMGTGESAVANNIIPQTHRIQRWDFTKCEIPDITQSKSNIVVSHCKLHNDASCDISQDGTFLATFVPSHRGFPDDNILAVYSLHPESFAQCLFTKSFGPNAISVSMSPRNHCVMVGLAAKRLSWVFTSNQLVAQVYKLDEKNAGEKSMKHMSDVFHPCDMDIRTHVSVNSSRWLRGVGEGLVYGTNRGDLHICRPGVKKVTMKASEEKPDIDGESGSGVGQDGTSIRMNLMSMLGAQSTRTSSIATQTLTRGIRRTAGTQTDTSQPSEEEEEEELEAVQDDV